MFRKIDRLQFFAVFECLFFNLLQRLRKGNRFHDGIHKCPFPNGINAFRNYQIFLIRIIQEHRTGNSCLSFHINNGRIAVCLFLCGRRREQLQIITELIVDELNATPESNETKAIRDLSCIIHFPTLNIPLNEWIIYSILTKWDWPEKDGEQAIFTFATSPHLSRNIPIISTNETINKETRQAIAKAHEGKESSTMSVDDLSKLDELIEDEIEFDWDLEALEEEEDTI